MQTLLRQQFQALLAASYGLTDEQARSTPTAGTLSISGLLKHICSVETSWMERVAMAPQPSPGDLGSLAERAAEYGADFSPTEAETVEVLRDRVGAVADRVASAIAGVNLEARVPAPDAPWFAQVGSWSVRWVLLHLIEEVARHVGHADLVRESIDGATAYELVAATEGWPPTPWLTPWTPPRQGALRDEVS